MDIYVLTRDSRPVHAIAKSSDQTNGESDADTESTLCNEFAVAIELRPINACGKE